METENNYRETSLVNICCTPHSSIRFSRLVSQTITTKASQLLTNCGFQCNILSFHNFKSIYNQAYKCNEKASSHLTGEKKCSNEALVRGNREPIPPNKP